MITINITSGTQVEGLRIGDVLENDLFEPSTSDAAKAAAFVDYLKRQLTLRTAFGKEWTLTNSEQYVDDNTTRIS